MRLKECPECKKLTLIYKHDDPITGVLDSAECENCGFIA